MTTKTEPLVACPECDLLQRETMPAPGGWMQCARCGAELFRNKPTSLDRTLALLMAATILYAVANFLPVMHFELQGLRTQTTLFGSAIALYDAGMHSVGLLVFATTIVFPSLELALMAYMLAPLHAGVVPHRLPFAFRLLRQVQPWGMVEVFMLGALVTLVKLRNIADAAPG